MARTAPPTPAADPGLPKLPPRRAQSPWVRRGLMFLACLLSINALIGERGLAETLRIRTQLQEMTAEIVRLRHENATLADYARRLATDPRTIENIARGELGLIREGEILVVLRDVPSR